MLPALCATAAALDAEALIARLAKPAPATVAFREVRFSRAAARAADRRRRARLHRVRPVSIAASRSLIAKHVAIRGESVRVEREGEPPRSFGLNRAPELRGLLSGFSALLAGDPAALERNFSVAANGSDDAVDAAS